MRVRVFDITQQHCSFTVFPHAALSKVTCKCLHVVWAVCVIYTLTVCLINQTKPSEQKSCIHAFHADESMRHIVLSAHRFLARPPSLLMVISAAELLQMFIPSTEITLDSMYL